MPGDILDHREMRPEALPICLLMLSGCFAPANATNAAFMLDVQKVAQPVMLSQTNGGGRGRYFVVETRDGHETLGIGRDPKTNRIGVWHRYDLTRVSASDQLVAQVRPSDGWVSIEEMKVGYDLQLRTFKIGASAR